MNPGTGVGELMRQAARLQRGVDKVRADIKDEEVAAEAAGGKVRVSVTCAGKIRRIHVEPDLLASEGLELCLDAVVAAANNALDSADQRVEAAVTKVTGGIKIPGM